MRSRQNSITKILSRFFHPLAYNGPVVWGVAVCGRVGMRFCKVPIDGQDFRVTIKLSR
jgi:hypothetical protein